jgi:hypothetical protein
VLGQRHTIEAKAVVMSVPCNGVGRDAFSELCSFRGEFYECLRGRGDELFELADALLCTDGPVKTLVELALAPEHRRGHGALYGGLNRGRIEIARLRRALAGLPLPRAADGRLVLAVDISPWVRPDAATSDERSFCHTYGRGENKHLMIPGWPYSWIVALESGRTSWCAPLDAVRLRPGDDLAAVTALQVRELVARLMAAGQWSGGDPLIWIVVDAGYDVPRLAWLLDDLPVEVLGRMRSDRVMRRPTPSLKEYALAYPQGGRPPRHGGEFIFKDARTWGVPSTETRTETTRYGTAHARGWDRLHPELQSRAAWAGHEGELPLIEGTVIRLQVDHLPSSGDPKPLWLWWSRTGATAAEVDLAWQAFLRRFDIEHHFRMIKQTLGWTAPKLRNPEAADRWTWIVIAACTQLRLARPLSQDLRRPWEKPVVPNKLTPTRVRRGFRHLRARTPTPARVPKPTRPGPGRPPGAKNRRRAERYEVGLMLATGQPYKRPTHHKAGTKPRRTG